MRRATRLEGVAIVSPSVSTQLLPTLCQLVVPISQQFLSCVEWSTDEHDCVLLVTCLHSSMGGNGGFVKQPLDSIQLRIENKRKEYWMEIEKIVNDSNALSK